MRMKWTWFWHLSSARLDSAHLRCVLAHRHLEAGPSLEAHEHGGVDGDGLADLVQLGGIAPHFLCLVKKRFLIAGGGAPETEVDRELILHENSLAGADAYCFKVNEIWLSPVA